MATPKSGDEKLLAVRAGGRRFALPASSVREMSRIPRLTVVPHAPSALLGIGNIRGEALSVVSAADLLGEPRGEVRHLAIMSGAQGAALAIDHVEGIVNADDALEKPDFASLLTAAFPVPLRKAANSRTARAANEKQAVDSQRLALLSFLVGEQLFALPIDQVEEVVLVPEDIARMPKADAVTLGAVAYRDGTLPVFSLAALLGFQSSNGRTSRIVVVRIGGQRVGFVVDGMRGLLRPAVETVDPVPLPLIRSEEEAVIHAIHRPEGGGRLVSILAADRLLRADITGQLMAAEDSDADLVAGPSAETSEMLLFESGGHRLLLPIGAIVEVALVPVRVTSLPRVPAFVLGVAAFRSEALAVIDLAVHLGADAVTSNKARVLVVEIAGMTTGLLVDRVLGLVRVPTDAIDDAPPMGDARTLQFGQVVSLDAGATATLLLSPTVLFSQVETDLIAGIATVSAPAA